MILYVKDHCAFSRRVLNAVETLGVELTIKNKKDEGVIDELVAVGGKQQFPCLVCGDGKVLYESDDIVSYLCSTMSGNPDDFPGAAHVCPVE